VLHMLELENGELRVGALHMFVGNNYILSVRRGAQKGFQDVRARSEREPELLERGSGYVLYALMDAVVDRYFPIIQHIESELERIEEQIFANKSARENIEQLYALKQKLTAAKHAVGPLLEALTNLSGTRVPQACVGMQEYFRDISDHLQRLNQTIESVRDTIATAISVNLSMITLQESETMKRLAAYAALIAVPTLIVGVYGMNFDHMPELRWRYGYGAVLTFMAVVDSYIFYRLRKAKWL
ncbi:MAG: magnesium and cobalt transport protein CorA, partial [Candidatus Obscuribacterales bacterium]|nr:magnesium and cobalt transport protein CorA [Steroidobacteraceae bacterium]